MKKNYGFDAKFNKIKLSARSLWMGFGRGEGELEIENQGRFDQSRFSQETVAIGQQTPRIGESRSTLRFTQRVSSAGCTLNSDSTPLSFSSAPAEAQFSSAPPVQVSSAALGEVSSMEKVSQFFFQERNGVQFALGESDSSANTNLQSQNLTSAGPSFFAPVIQEPVLFPLREENSFEIAAVRFPLPPEGLMQGKDLLLSDADIQLAKSDTEMAAHIVAGKMQNQLASILKAASRDEDSAI